MYQKKVTTFLRVSPLLILVPLASVANAQVGLGSAPVVSFSNVTVSTNPGAGGGDGTGTSSLTPFQGGVIDSNTSSGNSICAGITCGWYACSNLPTAPTENLLTGQQYPGVYSDTYFYNAALQVSWTITVKMPSSYEVHTSDSGMEVALAWQGSSVSVLDLGATAGMTGDSVGANTAVAMYVNTNNPQIIIPPSSYSFNYGGPFQYNYVFDSSVQNSMAMVQLSVGTTGLGGTYVGTYSTTAINFQLAGGGYTSNLTDTSFTAPEGSITLSLPSANVSFVGPN